jgi:hypothetical protein
MIFSQKSQRTLTLYTHKSDKGLHISHDMLSDISSLTLLSPETVLVLRALSTFEALYLSRTSNKMNESVGQAFQGGVHAPPSSPEGMNVARLIANELDAAKFDPLLVRSVARSANASLDMLLGRADGLVVRDRTATLLSGQSVTPQQGQNLSLATFLYHCGTRMQALEGEHSSDVYAILNSTVVVSARLNASTSLASNQPTEYDGDIPAYRGPPLSCCQVRLWRDHRQTTSRSNTID